MGELIRIHSPIQQIAHSPNASAGAERASNQTMRCAAGVLALAVAASACSPKAPPVIVMPAPTPSQRLASADALVRAGCLDCLISAYGEYELLRMVPSATDTATAGAVRSAALIAVREREMGLAD